MKKIIFTTIIILSFLPILTYGSTFSASDFAGADAELLISITGNGTKSITFDLQVIQPAYADIQGFWFSFNLFPSTLPAVEAGGDWTLATMGDDMVGSLGGDTEISPLGPFDFGIRFGDDTNNTLTSTSFTISNLENMFLDNTFAALLTFVTDSEEAPTSFSKLVGITTPIPEPSTMLLLGFGLLSLAGINRKK